MRKDHYHKRKQFRDEHPNLTAGLDWLAVFVAFTAFLYIALWAASPDSAKITFEEAVWRSLSYSVPLTLGMWAITRVTRAGSAVPPDIAGTIPYARIGKDGKIYSSTIEDDKAGNDPTPLGQDTTQALTDADIPDTCACGADTADCTCGCPQHCTCPDCKNEGDGHYA